MYDYEIECGDGVWLFCYTASDLSDWADFRDACGGRDHVRAVHVETGLVEREYAAG